MSHATYTTQALVLTSLEKREADRLFWLLTDELGVLTAMARSVRVENSKLRFSLQDLAYVRVSLVRGRAVWKIIGAEHLHAEALSISSMCVYGRLAALVRRLTPPYEVCPHIFVLLCNARVALSSYPDRTQECELLYAARILNALGYLPDNEQYAQEVRGDTFDETIADHVRIHFQTLLTAVNNAIAESQL